VPSTTCPKNLDLGGMPWQQGAEPALGIDVSWVLRCRVEEKAFPGEGVWQVLITERADGSPTALIAALSKPSVSPPAGIACPAIAMIVPWFMLVDGNDKAHLPKIPTTICGMPQDDVITALNALPFKVVKTERLAQTQSELSLKTGCSELWKDIIAITVPGPGVPPPSSGPIPPDQPNPSVPKPDGSDPAGGATEPGSIGSGGGSVSSVGSASAGSATAEPGTAGSGSAGSGAAEPARSFPGFASDSTSSIDMPVDPPATITPDATVTAEPIPAPEVKPTLCVYSSQSDQTGKLKRGRTLTDSELTALVSALEHGGPPHPCGIAHTQFAVVLGGDTGEWYAELDGCQRSLSPTSEVSQVSDSALAMLRA